MATAALTHPCSIGSIALQSVHKPRQCVERSVRIRCQASPDSYVPTKASKAAASRRSLLAAGAALPLSALLAGKAWAFVEEEEEMTSSERSRRDMMRGIQERASQEKAKVEAVVADIQETVQEQAAKLEEGTKSQLEDVVEAAPKAPEAVQKAAEPAQKAAEPVQSAAAQVQEVTQSIPEKVEKAAESFVQKVESVVAPSSETTGAQAPSEADLPLTGPNSAKRLKEARIREPTKEEKLPSSPDDIDPSDPVYQRMDSSKMPDLPYLFPKESYGTPWVAPKNSSDKIQPFFGPWDKGPKPEINITRPMVDTAPRKEKDEGVWSIYLGFANLVILGGYVIAKKAQRGEFKDWVAGPDAEEEKVEGEGEEPVQQMRAEKEAFDKAEAERVARGEPSGDSSQSGGGH